MIIQPNGQPKVPQQEPAIQVYWDAQKQAATVAVNHTQVTNWDFTVCVLQMALRAAEKMSRRTDAAEEFRQTQEAAQAAAVRRSLKQ